MEEKFINDLRQAIEGFNATLESYLPDLRNEVDSLIRTGTKDTNRIEHYLDTLLSISNFGVGTDLFVQLLEYYKGIDEEGAKFYWDEYDRKD